MNKYIKNFFYLICIVVGIMILKNIIWNGLDQIGLYLFAKKECKTLVFNADKDSYEIYAGDQTGYIRNEHEARKYCERRIISEVPELGNYFWK